MVQHVQVSRKTLASTPAANSAGSTVIAPRKVFDEDDMAAEMDRFQAELHKTYDLDENDELKPLKPTTLDETDISPEKIRSECERVFFYRNENPRPVWSSFFTDHFYERKRDWRLLGWYFRECGMAGQKIGIEIEAHNPKRQVLLTFPSTVNSFQRKSTFQLIQSLVGENYEVRNNNKMSTLLEPVSKRRRKKKEPKEPPDTVRNIGDDEPEESFGVR